MSSRCGRKLRKDLELSQMCVWVSFRRQTKAGYLQAKRSREDELGATENMYVCEENMYVRNAKRLSTK